MVEERIGSGVELRGSAQNDLPDVPSEPPPSGIRMSNANGDEPALSYKVYTLDELERLGGARASRASLAADGRGPSPWRAVFESLLVCARASLAWITTPKAQRPSAATALSPSADELAEHLRVALMSVDWRRVAVGGTIALGTAAALLFAVLTVAELTDDLKPATPGRTLTTAMAGSTTNATLAADDVGAPRPTETTTVTTGEPTIELADEPAPEPAPVAPARRPPPKSEVFIP